MKSAVCVACECAEPVQEPAELLRCRRYAPRPVAGDEPAGISWPLVRPEDWCGEFLEREPNDDDADSTV